MSDPDELPRALAIAWGIETAPRRGPKRELSHETIIDTAVEIADREGIEAVTMQRIAATFGYTTMALYRYVSSKDDLELLMCDRATAVAADGLIDDSSWRAGLTDWFNHIRAALRAHPWLNQMGPSALSVMVLVAMPNSMRVMDNGLRAMRTLSAPIDNKITLLLRINDLARQAVSRELNRPPHTLSEAAIEAVSEVATRDRFPDLYEIIENRSYFAGAHIEFSDAEQFEAALAAELDQIEATAGKPVPPRNLEQLSPPDAAAEAERAWRTAVALRKRATAEVNRLSKVEGTRRAEFETARHAAKLAAKARGAD